MCLFWVRPSRCLAETATISWLVIPVPSQLLLETAQCIQVWQQSLSSDLIWSHGVFSQRFSPQLISRLLSFAQLFSADHGCSYLMSSELFSSLLNSPALFSFQLTTATTTATASTAEICATPATLVICPTAAADREAFTQRSVYAEKLLHTASVYTEKFLHTASVCTEKLLHREASPQRSFYSEEPFHTEAYGLSSSFLLPLLPLLLLLLLSSASLSGFHLACRSWGKLSPLPPCPLPCRSLLSSQRLIHRTWRYFAWGGTCLVYGQPPRVHIKLPWGHLSMAGGLAEGN